MRVNESESASVGMCHGPAKSGRARFLGTAALIILMLSEPVSLAAQTTTPETDRATPYGSPLGQDYYYYQAQTSTANGSGTTSTIQPVEVNGAENSNSTNSSSNTSSTSETSSTDVTGTTDTQGQTSRTGRSQAAETDTLVKKAAAPSEYETFVEKMLGKKLERFGASLVIPATRNFSLPATATVPPSYVLNPGDTILIGLSGSVDGTVNATVDNNGNIFLPKVGSVHLAGVTYGGLKDTIVRAIGLQYRDFRVSVSIAKLRGIRVYVTGFANNPGAYTVNSLSTMVNAVLAAGGPNAGGSFRSIKLYRNGELVSDFDLYDLIRSGNKSKDVILQNEDVLYIPAIGPQVAFTGSVNDEAIYEAKPGESMETLLGYAGGPNVLADKSRVILYRLSDQENIGREVPRATLAATPGEGGDIVQLLSEGSLTKPLERQSVVVRVEGEVGRPGNYYVPPNTSLDQVMQMAGGATPRAFVYGTSLQRTSVRQQQRQSYQEAIEQLELSLAAAPLTRDSAIDSSTSEAQIASARMVLQRMRQAQPDGRVVLDLGPDSTSLPGDLVLENNDRIYIPPRPTTVGVFGAVYRPASFLIDRTKPLRVKDYVQRAGGTLRAADRGQLFLVHANGAVISKRNGALNERVLPGDVVFVPIKTQSTSPWAKILQISTVLFQLGLATAAFVALSN